MNNTQSLSTNFLGGKITGILISLLAALGITYFLKEPGFNHSQIYVLFLLFFAAGLWISDAIAPFAVGLFIMLYLVFMLGHPSVNEDPINVKQFVNTFSSSTIWLLLGGFFLAAAMSKTKLDEDLFRFALNKSGSTPKGLLIWLMVATMLASTIMSNTAATAMVIAMVMPLLNASGRGSNLSKALLIGIPLAASTGGMATIIGTPPNAIAVDALAKAGVYIDFLDWMKYGAPLAIILTVLGAYIIIKFYIKDNSTINVDNLIPQVKERTSEEKLNRKLVLFILTTTILLWLTESIHGLNVAFVTAIPIVFLTFTGVLTGKDVSNLSWDTLLLMAGALSLGLALQSTGLLSHYSSMMSDINVSPWMFVILLAFITMVISNFMSHTAASTVLIPVGLILLAGNEVEAALIISLASSTALFLPVSTPPNAIAYSTGYLEQKDFRIAGIIIGLIGPVLVVMWTMTLGN